MPGKPRMRPSFPPEPGTFRKRLVSRGPWVAAMIKHDERGWSAVVNGDPVGPAHPDPALAPGVLEIWTTAEFIPQSEYDYLLQLKAHAERHAPDSPAANPRKRINLRTLEPIYRGRN